MTDTTKIVVLAGATGKLGALAAEALLEKPDVQLRVLVRPSSVEKVSALREKGVEIYEVDLENAEHDDELATALNGAYSVLSAVAGESGPGIMVDGQLRLLDFARKSGVRRFIPSYFSYNIFGLDRGENFNTDILQTFATKAEDIKGDVELVQIQIGAFTDRTILFGFLGAFDLSQGEAFLWGDGKAKMDFTTYQDTARFAAEVAVDDNALPETLQFAGDSLTFAELVEAYETASGKSITVREMGSLDDLGTEIQNRIDAEPGNFFAWLPLMYWRALLSGKVKLHSIDNERYQQVETRTVAQYVEEEGI